MRARRRRLIILTFVGTALSAAAAITVAACTNDYIPIPLGDPYADGGSGSAASSVDGAKARGDGAASGDDDDSTDSGGADCSAAAVLRGSTTGTFFCPFLPKNTDASATNCADDETCCNPGADPVSKKFPSSFCATTPRDTKGATDQGACTDQAAAHATAWNAAGGTTWECADQNNCTSGQVCCMFSDPTVVAPDKVNMGPDTTKGIPTACNAKQAFKYGGTHCASSCSSDTEIQMCGTDGDCTAPKKCRPFEVAVGVRDLGYCN